jgi:hypothetical protein
MCFFFVSFTKLMHPIQSTCVDQSLATANPPFSGIITTTYDAKEHHEAHLLAEDIATQCSFPEILPGHQTTGMAAENFLEAIGEHQATFRAPTDTAFHEIDRLDIDMWDLNQVLPSSFDLGLQEHSLSSEGASTDVPQFTDISSEFSTSPSTVTSM